MPHLTTRDGARFHYLDVGRKRGPACVLIHGFGMQGAMWLPVIAPLLLKQRFILPDLRGFGGSQLLDCVKLVNHLVLPYQPRLVVVYAGENDLAEGASPRDVAERFTAFVQAVKAALPDTRIAFVSIKPSPLRSGMLPAVREANELVRAYSQTEPWLDYIDVFSSMLDDQGQPRAELFQGDRLHLNADGYAIWQRIIALHLKG